MTLIAGILAMAMLGSPGAGPGVRDLVPQVVSTAREHALRNSRPGSVAGPVLVDAGSFAAVGQTLGERVSSENVVAWSGRGARAVAGGGGIVCETANAGRRCSVADRGVILRVQSATRTAAGVDVVVRAEWTDRRPSGASAVSGHTIRLSFAEKGGAWHLAGKSILRRG